MTPSTDYSGQPVGLADAFDVPVFVRHSSPLNPESRPRKSRVDHAAQPWPGTRRAPRAGNYLIPTTWREVLDAARVPGTDLVIGMSRRLFAACRRLESATADTYIAIDITTSALDTQ